jgi:uncharacterized protein (DUF302 family)
VRFLRMTKTLMISVTLLLGANVAVQAATPSNLFIIRTSAKTPDAIVEGIKTYVEAHKWQYIGATKVKKGEITLVKVCIPEVGKLVWPQGLYLSALLPCGNLGIYTKAGKTEVSMLNPRYMHVLVPTPEMAKASKVAEPLLNNMLDAALK